MEAKVMMKPHAVPEIRHPGPAPLEYVGQWVAWNRELTEIVAHGRDLSDVHAAAEAAGHRDAVLEKVRRPCSFIGRI
jgi:hypothetical protein